MPSTKYDKFNLVVSTFFFYKWYLRKSTFLRMTLYDVRLLCVQSICWLWAQATCSQSTCNAKDKTSLRHSCKSNRTVILNPFHNWRTSRMFVRPKKLDMVRKLLPNYRIFKGTRTKLARFRATVVRSKRIESCDLSCVCMRLLYNESDCCKIMR